MAGSETEGPAPLIIAFPLPLMLSVICLDSRYWQVLGPEIRGIRD